ncbi:MAG: hypothetical protein JXA68_04630 [Ignavibacteriales bacterium]|nr:hypothetical protein [Ignavibacteriales bacterium]
MEFIDNKSQDWQGWNDFLGISKGDAHNYIINLIGDIIDGFLTEKKEEELGEILTSVESDSYLFFSEYVYKYAMRESDAWMQLLIYKVEQYFVIVEFSSEGVILCSYAGDDLRFAFDLFRQIFETTQSRFKETLDRTILSVYDSKDNQLFNDDLRDYYLLTGYILPEITEDYFEYLKMSLSKYQESQQFMN